MMLILHIQEEIGSNLPIASLLILKFQGNDTFLILIFFYKSILRQYLAYKYLMLSIFAFQDPVTKNYTHYLIFGATFHKP